MTFGLLLAVTAMATRLGGELARVVHAPEARAAQVADALVHAGADEAEARALLVTGWYESDLRLAVERCEIRGAAGEVGVFQELARGPRAEALCAGGLPAQARAAVAHWRSCPSEDLGERFGCYMHRKASSPKVAIRLATLGAMWAP